MGNLSFYNPFATPDYRTMWLTKRAAGTAPGLSQSDRIAADSKAAGETLDRMQNDYDSVMNDLMNSNADQGIMDWLSGKTEQAEREAKYDQAVRDNGGYHTMPLKEFMGQLQADREAYKAKNNGSLAGYTLGAGGDAYLQEYGKGIDPAVLGDVSHPMDSDRAQFLTDKTRRANEAYRSLQRGLSSDQVLASLKGAGNDQKASFYDQAAANMNDEQLRQYGLATMHGYNVNAPTSEASRQAEQLWNTLTPEQKRQRAANALSGDQYWSEYNPSTMVNANEQFASGKDIRETANESFTNLRNSGVFNRNDEWENHAQKGVNDLYRANKMRNLEEAQRAGIQGTDLARLADNKNIGNYNSWEDFLRSGSVSSKDVGRYEEEMQSHNSLAAQEQELNQRIAQRTADRAEYRKDMEAYKASHGDSLAGYTPGAGGHKVADWIVAKEKAREQEMTVLRQRARDLRQVRGQSPAAQTAIAQQPPQPQQQTNQGQQTPQQVQNPQPPQTPTAQQPPQTPQQTATQQNQQQPTTLVANTANQGPYASVPTVKQPARPTPNKPVQQPTNKTTQPWAPRGATATPEGRAKLKQDQAAGMAHAESIVAKAAVANGQTKAPQPATGGANNPIRLNKVPAAGVPR